MDANLSAWMISGGPRIETPPVNRDQLHLATLRAEARLDRLGPGLVARLAAALRPTPARSSLDAACCPA